MAQVMQPSHANPSGNVHGGEIMKIMDITAAVVAKKHAMTNTVTARVDELEFHQPIYVGELLTCRGNLVYVGRSSMEVAITVEVDDMETEDPPRIALSAYFTMVALGKDGTPTEVPELECRTPEEQSAFEEGKIRYLLHKERKRLY